MDIGYVKFIRPKNAELHRYIKGYYIHRSDRSDFYTSLTFYQNITTTLSIYKDTQLSSEGRKRTQTFRENQGFQTLLAAKVDKYQEVEFLGPLDRIAIVFYPLGLNHFIQEPLGNFVKLHYSIFTYFEEEFAALLPQVYDEPVLEKKRDLLDVFFQEKFYEFPEKRLKKAVDRLIKSVASVKVEQLAEELNVSRRTLHRLFKKHLSYSPEEYSSVIKFRQALYNFQKKQDNFKLSDIALDSEYYDQPDFNRQFKSRSGLSPTELFKQLEIVDDVLFWNPG